MRKILRQIKNYTKAQKDKIHLSKVNLVNDRKYTVCITTFDARFEKYLKPLIKQIKKSKPNIEIIITVNGNYNNNFNQVYRKNLLMFLSEYENTFPIFFTEFRSLAKLWNSLLIHSSHKYIFLINDDITIKARFWDYFEKAIELKESTSFTINNSWSNVFLNRNEIADIGWFDERLLGIGEEDGDMAWRYANHFKKELDNVYLSDIINHVEMNDCKQTFDKINNSKKYSLFNRKFITKKYIKDENNGKQFGLFPHKVKCVIENKNQYPYEKYYWKNKNKL